MRLLRPPENCTNFLFFFFLSKLKLCDWELLELAENILFWISSVLMLTHLHLRQTSLSMQLTPTWEDLWKRPGAHEMLSLLILRDRVNTISILSLIHDSVLRSFRKNRRQREKNVRVKGRENDGKRERQTERWREYGYFNAFRNTGGSSQTHWCEWKRLVSLSFQLKSEPV